MASPVSASPDFIKSELEVIKTKYKRIPGAELVSCVPIMVQIKLVKTKHKTLTACFQFPEEYPSKPVLIELKSKVMYEKLLDGLTRVCEEEAKKICGQQQVIPVVKFINKFIVENPLCVCSKEIGIIKQQYLGDDDEIKLKQKTSQLVLKVKEKNYFINIRFTIPDNYPLSQLGIEVTQTNFPELLKVNILGQSIEITRRCVEPPLKRNPKDPPFEPHPALQPVVEFITKDVIRQFPIQACPVCQKRALPTDPQKNVSNPHDGHFVERVYCGHLFHHGCLNVYMKTPPFTGGKKCPSCGKRIYHDKWKAPPEVAEARWAHQEARRRELDEVVDFLE